MPQTDAAEAAPEHTADDLPELTRNLAKLLLAQHSDSRSLADIKRQMTARGKEIDATCDIIEHLEDLTGDYGPE